ncbi:HU family DNA-binding protein [Candidatus Spongiihabitans sp.]|uniref:HU family DNA-binding protein n=1 Tax=Candidatus Spongiihabitans sp. TaxID=3101308 RepID=UPI003C6EF29E
MNKSDLTEAVVASANLNKSSAGKAVDAVFEAIEGAMSRGDSVSLIGFGTFSVSDRAARTGRNPRTGETIQIAASRVAKFKAGKGLKEALN